MYFRGIDGVPFWLSTRFWGLVILFIVNVLAYFGVPLPDVVFVVLEALGFTTVAVGAANARAPLTAGATKIYEEVPDERKNPDGKG